MNDDVNTISLHDLTQKIGTVVGISAWYTIDQQLIDNFGTLTLDRYFIHVDPERAKNESPYGGTIAHGLLILSLLSDMASSSLPVCSGMRSAVNYGFDKIRFVEAVPSGSRVRAHFKLAAVSERSASQVLLRYSVHVEIENNVKPALIADWLSLIFLA